MDTTLFYAILFISLACFAYTLGVWAEKIRGKLKIWHAMVFWLGFIFDTIGTTAMSIISGSLIKFNFHGMTGLAALLLMLFHASWASWVLYRKDEILILKFHRFSIVVWILWLIPMVTGMIFGASV